MSLKIASMLCLAVMVTGVLMGSGVAPAAYNLIQNNTVSITRRSTINFVNGGCVDNAGTLASDCTFLTTVPANFSCAFTTQTTVACTHNLNTLFPIVAVYDAASPPNLILPATEKITSANVVTVTFSVAQSGTVVVSGASGSGTSGVSSVQTATGAVTLFNNNAQTANYQFLSADFIACKTITIASGTFNVTLVASGTQPPDGQCVRVLNYGTGVVTVVRSGQNINGAAANQTIAAGSASAATGLLVTSDGANYFAQPLGSGGGGGGGSPGGSATQWQYNNSTFGGLVGTSAIPQSGWSIINGGSQAVYNDFSQAFQLFQITNNASVNLRSLTRSLPSSTSYTMIATIQCILSRVVDAQTCGISVSDGTKYENLELVYETSATPDPQLRVETWSNVTTPTSTLAGPTANLSGNIVTLKIVGDATHRTFYYWNNGAYTQFFQENIGTFLTETTGGIALLSNSAVASDFLGAQLMYWSLTNP